MNRSGSVEVRAADEQAGWARHLRGRICLTFGLAIATALFLGVTGCPPAGGGGGDGGGDGGGGDGGGGGGDGGGGGGIVGIGDGALATYRTPSRSTSIALSANDRLLVVVNREANTVSFIEVLDENGQDVGSKIGEVAVGIEPRFLAISPNDTTVFVSNTVSGTISVITLTGDTPLTVVGEIPVGTEPRGIALTPNGTRLFVANHTAGTVSVIDTAQRTVINTVPVGGNPTAIAITNNGDTSDNDETVFVTEFFAETIPGGPGEASDTGKRGVVSAFTVANPTAVTRINLSPLANVGFTADRRNFCQQLNAQAHSNLFCPDVNVTDATNPVIAQDPQGAFPNQLGSALIRGNRLFLPNIGAAPEPPIRFNVNVQALVHVVDVSGQQEIAAEHVNLNNQVRTETQPADPTTSLVRLFGNDLVAIDANTDGSVFLIVSRGGNYVFRATLDANGALSLGAPSVVRFQAGNLPNGVVINSTGNRAYVNNELNLSVSALNLQNNTTITRDIPSGEPPEPGTFEHGVLVGKLAFFTALGVPDNGIFGTPLRDIVPLADRGKQSDNAWSSCASCHPDGLTDRVTWIFATGPRQTISLDAFFAKDNPRDQRISNWSAVRSSVTDFNENSINVQGGVGFAGTPPNPAIFNHGIDQGASDALDAQTLWVQTIRPVILPAVTDTAALDRGRAVFSTFCASCHGGAKWTKSQVIYAHNPAFTFDPAAGGVPRDPGLTNAAAQLLFYDADGQTINLSDVVGTFDPDNPIEIRATGQTALGANGFNTPSLLGLPYGQPFLHDGSAPTVAEVFNRHLLPGQSTIASELSIQQLGDLFLFLNSIDGSTGQFRSQMDDFRDAVAGQ